MRISVNKNLLWVLCLPLLLWGCGSGNNSTNRAVPCTTEIRAGVVAVIRDAVTNEFIAEGAVATLTSDNYSETMTAGGFQPNADGTMVLASLKGADERPGVYTLRVERAGYQPFVRTGIPVIADLCHVQTVVVEVNLQPIP